MIADNIIPYLIFHHRPNIAPFFDIEAVRVKEEWHWNNKRKCSINPLSKELDALEDGDQDYQFEAWEDDEVTTTNELGDSVPLTAQ